MSATNQLRSRKATILHTLKLIFGWLGIAVDGACILLAGYIILIAFQPNGADILFALVLFGPILLGIMLVATAVAILCFRSASRD